MRYDEDEDVIDLENITNPDQCERAIKVVLGEVETDMLELAEAQMFLNVAPTESQFCNYIRNLDIIKNYMIVDVLTQELQTIVNSKEPLTFALSKLVCDIIPTDYLHDFRILFSCTKRDNARYMSIKEQSFNNFVNFDEFSQEERERAILLRIYGYDGEITTLKHFSNLEKLELKIENVPSNVILPPNLKELKMYLADTVRIPMPQKLETVKLVQGQRFSTKDEAMEFLRNMPTSVKSISCLEANMMKYLPSHITEISDMDLTIFLNIVPIGSVKKVAICNDHNTHVPRNLPGSEIWKLEELRIASYIQSKYMNEIFNHVDKTQLKTITSSYCKDIYDCTHIEELSTDIGNFTQIENLRFSPTLKRLNIDLRFTPENYWCRLFFRNLPELEYLNITNNAAHFSLDNILSYMYKSTLKTLKLNSFWQAGMTDLTIFSSLTHLVVNSIFNGISMGEDWIAPTSLEILEINDNSLPINFIELVNLKKVYTLTLHLYDDVNYDLRHMRELRMLVVNVRGLLYKFAAQVRPSVMCYPDSIVIKK